jgi:oligoendopeptidase F
VAAAVLSVAVGAQERDRSKIPDRYKWNLADIYPNEAAWRAAKDKLAAELPQLRQYEGKLASSASTLADALDNEYALDKELSRLYVYVSMLADEDTRDPKHQGMKQEMVQLASSFGAQASFIEPELLRTGKPTLERFVTSEPRLKIYRFYIEDVARRRHTLTDNEERILAESD